MYQGDGENVVMTSSWWDPDRMELDELDELDADDQWLILLGRIAKEQVSMETQLRGLYAQLKYDERTRENLFKTPREWRKLHRETKQMVESLKIKKGIRIAILDAIAAAHAANDGRNKYMHRELLRHEQWDTEEPATGEPVVIARGDRLQVTTWSEDGVPAPEQVTLESAHQLVSDLIGAGWRLRFARLHLEARGRWESELTAHVVGTWDGNADVIGGVDVTD